MKKGFIIGLSIFTGIVLLLAGAIGIFVMHFMQQMTWHIHEPMTGEQQVKLASMGLVPDVADQLERYGDRGLRDSEYMAESFLYDDKDDMIASLPAGYEIYVDQALKGGAELSEDIKGTKVTRYQFYGLPQATREELGDKYEYYFYGVFHYYYILEYEDGTYRFAVEIDNT